MSSKVEGIATLLCAHLCIFAVTIQTTGCSSKPDIHEYPRFIDVPDRDNLIDRVPDIVVGTIIAVNAVGGPRPSEWDHTPPVQLFQVDIDVENVLAGTLPKGHQSIYFFRTLGSWNGPDRLGLRGQGGRWHLGDREMFFLQRDKGFLRTICDDLNHCVIAVLGGKRSSSYRDPQSWIGNAIADFLLSPGDGCTDAGMASIIRTNISAAYQFSGVYALQKLQSLAAGKSTIIRSAACETLATYEKPCTRPPP